VSFLKYDKEINSVSQDSRMPLGMGKKIPQSLSNVTHHFKNSKSDLSILEKKRQPSRSGDL
jgi:hypothetical protein